MVTSGQKHTTWWVCVGFLISSVIYLVSMGEPVECAPVCYVCTAHEYACRCVCGYWQSPEVKVRCLL